VTTLTASDYRTLLQVALPSAMDADTIEPDLRTLFTPDAHRLALDPEVTVVRGARGAGKTVWFRSLQKPVLRAVAAEAYRLPRLTRATPLAGYGSTLEPDRYPGPATLAALMKSGIDPDLIWTAVLLTALNVTDLRALHEWAERVRWVEANPDSRDRALAEADRRAGAEGEFYLLLFDALDRMHPERRETDRLVAGVLRLALDLRTRTRNIRAKVFIRHDMLDDSVQRFPDASKLTSNAADLVWDRTNLYGLLFYLLGNADDDLSRGFRAATPTWKAGDQRHVPPSDVVGDSERQRTIFTWIAGPHMGTNHRKGLTYTWLPNHLMDGIGQVSPRSFQSALVSATQLTSASFAGHQYALHWEGIRQGVLAASKIRVKEIDEDLRWVAIAARQLEGLQVPVEQSMIVARWTERSLADQLRSELEAADGDAVQTGPRRVDDYPGLINELIEVGVMARRSDGRLDLPDVYRIAFGVGRRGGIPRVRR
jgi:hypothetical protein